MKKSIGSRLRHVVPVLLLLVCFGVPSPAYGAASVIIAADTTPDVGDTITVTVKYSAESIGRINGELRYDPDMFQYESGGSSGQSAGIVQLSNGLDGEKTYTYNIRFTVIGPGEDFFLVNTFELVNGDEEDLGNPGASVAVSVAAPAEDPAVTNPDPATPDDPVDEPTDTTDNPGTGSDAPEDTQKTPATHWVYAGAVGLTSLMLLAAVLIVRHGRTKK